MKQPSFFIGCLTRPSGLVSGAIFFDTPRPATRLHSPGRRIGAFSPPSKNQPPHGARRKSGGDDHLGRFEGEVAVVTGGNSGIGSAAAKAAVVNLAKTLSGDLAERGIRVNAIVLGATGRTGLEIAHAPREQPMRQTIRIFMLFEAVTYITAALIHSGTLIAGYDHHRARVAEYVIATVLLAAVATTWIVPAWTRRAGLAGQAFALLATLVGLFTIAIGIGPRTKPDIVYHVSIVAVLIWGLGVAERAPEDNGNRPR